MCSCCVRLSFQRGQMKIMCASKVSLRVTVDFYSIHCSPSILGGCCRPCSPRHYNSRCINALSGYYRRGLPRGHDCSVLCCRVILAMPKSLTLHRVIPFGRSPSPLPINWSEFSLLLPQAFLCLRSAGAQAPSQISSRGWFFGPLQCRRGEQILKSGLLKASAVVSPKHGCAPPLLLNGTPKSLEGLLHFPRHFLRSRQCHDARNASAVFKSAECRESPGRLHHDHPPDLRPQEAEGSRGSRRSVRAPGWSAAAQEALLRDQISLADSLQWENRWIAGGKQPVQ